MAAVFKPLVIERCLDRSWRVHFMHSTAVRLRYKKRWVEMGRKKVKPRELALSYFDTYYPAVYGERCWLESREALLKKKKKYCALVNNFANAEKIMEDLMSEQEAYNMFALTGDVLKVPETVSLENEGEEVNAEPKTTWQALSIDMSDSVPNGQPEFEETDEGFVVPKAKESNSIDIKPYHAPDVYDYMPAVTMATEEQQMQENLERQTLLLDSELCADILPAADLILPPTIKCFVHQTGHVQAFHSPRVDDSKLLGYYLFDAASVLPVLALDLKPHDTVLDLCAAPGGKSLVIAQSLITDEIVCVDSSFSRLNRLKDTFRWYVPGSMDQDSPSSPLSIRVIHDDARNMGDKQPASFDKVLVDAPCNTDRKSVNEDENSRFKRTRVTERLRLPELQTELLMSGLLACKPGGVVIYSTCTLTPGQNDHVVEAAIVQLGEKRPDVEVAVENTQPIADRFGHMFLFWTGSRYGQVVLPTAAANFGPAYFAKLRRIR